MSSPGPSLVHTPAKFNKYTGFFPDLEAFPDRHTARDSRTVSFRKMKRITNSSKQSRELDTWQRVWR